MEKAIIALVGMPLSGKDTAGKYLEQHYGFRHVSTGQLVRDHIAKNDLGEPTRELMVKTANDLRLSHGADYFVKKAIAAGGGRVIVDGIRAVGELKAVKQLEGIVIATLAPLEKRYQWAKARNRVSDRVSLEDFRQDEEVEMHSESEHKQNISSMIENADHLIENNDSLEKLFEKVDELMIKLGIEKQVVEEA